MILENIKYYVENVKELSVLPYLLNEMAIKDYQHFYQVTWETKN
jgi:hypothetical protein